jgi:hypothetical protein
VIPRITNVRITIVRSKICVENMFNRNSYYIGKVSSSIYLAFCSLLIILAVSHNPYWIMGISAVSIPTILTGGMLMSFSSVLFVSMGWANDSLIGNYLFYFDFVIHIVVNLFILNVLGYFIHKIYHKWFSVSDQF